MNFNYPNDPEKTVLLVVAVILVLFWVFRNKFSNTEFTILCRLCLLFLGMIGFIFLISRLA